MEARESLYHGLQHRTGLTSFLHVNEGSVESVAFSPDGKTIAAGCQRLRLRGVVLWDVATRKRLVGEPFPMKEGRCLSVAFSPDGKTIAAGYYIFRGGSASAAAWFFGT